MIQTRQIGRARVTRVLEYSAPTHDPAFLFPDLAQADLDAMAAKLAPHHYVPAMNRLVITIQMWVVQIDGKVIVIDTGVGNGKPRTAPRMKNLNIRVGEWLEAAGAGFDKVTHVVQTHLHADHTGWNTVLEDGKWVPAFPNARYLMPRKDYDYWSDAITKAPDIAMDNSWEDSVLPVIEARQVDFIDEDAGKILNRDPLVKTAPGIGPGTYVLTITCDGGGKAFFDVSLDGTRLSEAGAACNGSRETARIKVPAAGTLQISTSSVDAPLIYAYQLAPAQ